MPSRRSVCDEDLRSSRQGSQALSVDERTDITDESSYQQDPASHQVIRQQQQQKQQQQVIPQQVASTKNLVQRSGTPGPGRYDLPSTFVNVGATQNASGYVLATPHLGASIKGRNWPSPDDPIGGSHSPRPLAYSPVLEAASAKRKAPRAVFSDADREKQDKIYLGSEDLNRSGSRSASPGPQAYRVAMGRNFGRQSPGPPAGPRATFGANRFAPSHLTAAVSAAAAQNRSKTSLGFYADHQVNGNLSTAISIQDHHGNKIKREYPWRARSCEPGATSASVAVFDPAAFLAEAAKGGTSKEVHSALTAAAGLGEPNGAGPKSKSAAVKAFYSDREGIGGHAWSFGPPGGLAAGQQRRRSQEGNVYISSQHATADRGPKAARSIPGAGAYDIGNKLQVLSTHRAEGMTPFDRAERGKVKLYLSPDLVKVDPSLTYSPGPGTAGADSPGTLSAAAAGTLHSARIGPRFGSPLRHPLAKQPIISRQHDVPGEDSPGPAAYNTMAAALAGTTLGDRRAAHFGTGTRDLSGAVVKTFAPGPGAYTVDEGKLSTHASSPAYGLGRGHKSQMPSGQVTPGVGQYSLTAADRQVLPNSGIATMKGKLAHGGHVTPTCSPGPAYFPMGGMGYEAEVDWHLRWGDKYGFSFPGEDLVQHENVAAVQDDRHHTHVTTAAGEDQESTPSHQKQLSLHLSATVYQADNDKTCIQNNRHTMDPGNATARSSSSVNLATYRSGVSMLSVGVGNGVLKSGSQLSATMRQQPESSASPGKSPLSTFQSEAHQGPGRFSS